MTATDSTARHIDLARKYIATVQAGDDVAALRRLVHPDVEQEEFPNALVPRGQKRGLAGMVEGFEKGRALVAEQRFEIVNIFGSGEQVMLELVWTGTMRVDAGPLRAGQTLRARISAVLEFRDGQVFRQRNYDCYDPL